MGRRTWEALVYAALAALPLSAGAQNTLTGHAQDIGGGTAAAGGSHTIDFVVLKALNPGVPLRHGNVVPSSEQVLFGGAVLQRGTDYSMDYSAGVVYLMRAQREGDTLTVSYRFTSAGTGSSGGASTSGLAGFNFSLLPGSLKMMMGLGVAERAADGSVSTSNVFGWNNSFSFGGSSSLTGLLLMGQKTQQNNRSAFESDSPQGPVDAGKSQFLVQNLSSRILGGNVSFDFQDISKNFTAFESAKQAGFDDARVGQLQKERGLQRFGMGLTGLKIGTVALSNGFRVVKDGSSSIEWRSFGFADKGLTLDWKQQRVDSKFTRFADLAEEDREQLKKELGLEREALAGGFDFKFGKMTFNTSKISDTTSQTPSAVHKQDVGLDTGNIKFNITDERVDKSFTKFQNLQDAEKAMGSDVGLRRQTMNFQANVFGKDAPPLLFATNKISADSHAFESVDASVGGKAWSLTHSARKVDAKYTNLSQMIDPEKDSNINAVASMYANLAGPPVNPGQEHSWWLQSAGISRDYTKFAAAPLKNLNVVFSDLKLQGEKDGAAVKDYQATGKGFNFDYRHETIGKDFAELGSLLNFERQRLGAVSGFDRTDLATDFTIGGHNIGFSRLDAAATDGGVKRQTFSFTDKSLDVHTATRVVDPKYGEVNQIVDPEKDLLTSLLGFNERDTKVKWRLLPSLSFDGSYLNSSSDSLHQNNLIQSSYFDWSPNKKTEVTHLSARQHLDGPFSVLFANQTEKTTLMHDFGRLGVLNLCNEQQKFDAKVNPQPDFSRHILTYETKIDDRTSVRTEQSQTRYGNGDKENVNTNVVSTAITKRVGVSMAETAITTQDAAKDQNKRNYGFWYDLGKGLRVSYGYDLQGTDHNTASNGVFTVGQNPSNVKPDQVGQVPTGQAGNFTVGGGYGVNQWDTATTRTQSFGNVRFGTANPIRLGIVQDVKFNFLFDSSADVSKWVRENKQFDISGRVGSTNFAVGYRGQLDHTGFRGVDRLFSLTTDQTDTRPFRAIVFYKARTLPTGQVVMIRNYTLAAKVGKNFDLRNEFLTNPEESKGDALLGSITRAARVDKWKLDYKQGEDTALGLEWAESIDDSKLTLQRTMGLNVTLFNSTKRSKNGTKSPVSLFYGYELFDGAGRPRNSTARYSLKFDQAAGPNQSFSIYTGNLSYGGVLPPGQRLNNVSFRMDYSLRF